jgi:polyisoprenyl-phosphate glycosyltransferase
METDAVEISVVIPVYRSSDCLPELLRQLTRQLEEMGRPYEVILVDDASPDDSWRVIKETVPRYPKVTAIRLMRNRGQASATLCGLEHARGEVVVTMDDDLQQPPDQLPKLLDTLESDAEIDCVFGYFEQKQHAAYRNLGSRAIRWVNARAFGLPRDLRASSFRAMRKRLAEAILRHRTLNPAIAALLYGSTRRIVSVPVQHKERFAGRSNYTLAKQFRLALDNICNVSMLPLRAVSFLGTGICAFSAVLVAVFLYRYFTGQTGVAGWTTVVILISFFSGVILLSLGVIGEYIVRILREVRGAPRYVERERIAYPAHSEDVTDRVGNCSSRVVEETNE